VADLGSGVGDAGERRLGYAVEALPENGVGRTKHRVLDRGAAHHRLMIVVVHRVLGRRAALRPARRRCAC